MIPVGFAREKVINQGNPLAQIRVASSRDFNSVTQASKSISQVQPQSISCSRDFCITEKSEEDIERIKTWAQTAIFHPNESALLKTKLINHSQKHLSVLWAEFQKDIAHPGDFLLCALEDPDLSKFAQETLLNEPFWLVQKERLKNLMRLPSFGRLLCPFFESLIQNHLQSCFLRSIDTKDFADSFIEAIEYLFHQHQTSRCEASSRIFLSPLSYTSSPKYFPFLELKKIWEYISSQIDLSLSWDEFLQRIRFNGPSVLPNNTGLEFEALRNEIVGAPGSYIQQHGWLSFLKRLASLKDTGLPLEYEKSFLELVDLNEVVHDKDFLEVSSFLFCIKVSFYETASFMLKKQTFKNSLNEKILSQINRADGWVQKLALHLWENPKAECIASTLLVDHPDLFTSSKIRENWLKSAPKHLCEFKARSIYAFTNCDEFVQVQLRTLAQCRNWADIFLLVDEAPLDYQPSLVNQASLSCIEEKEYSFLLCFLARYSKLLALQKNHEKEWFLKLLQQAPFEEAEKIVTFLLEEMGDREFNDYFNDSKQDVTFETPSLAVRAALDGNWNWVYAFLEIGLFLPQVQPNECSPLRNALKDKTDKSGLVETLLVEHREIFSRYCAHTTEGMSDLEYMLSSPDRFALAKVYIQTCNQMGFDFLKPLCLQIVKHFLYKNAFDPMLVALESDLSLMSHISIEKWERIINRMIENDASEKQFKWLGELIKNHLAHLTPNAPSFLDWKTLVIKLHRRSLSENHSSLKAFVRRLNTLVKLPKVQLLAIALVTSCQERASSLDFILNAKDPRYWVDSINGLTLLHYICREETSNLKTNTIKTVLESKALSPLAFMLDHQGSTALHVLFEQNDLDSFQAYLAAQPSAILVQNTKNQSCLQLVSVFDTPLIEVCPETLTTIEAKFRICTSIYKHGIRFGYLPQNQLRLLGIQNSDPQVLWSYLVERARLYSIKDNPLAKIYFCPFPFDYVEALSSFEKATLLQWVLELKSNPYLFDFAQNITGIRPSFDLSYFTPAKWFSSFKNHSALWNLDIKVPEDFVFQLEKTLGEFVNHLVQKKSAGFDLSAILQEHEIASVERCPMLSSELISRLKDHRKIKGLSDNPQEKDLYYSRFKQVLFVIFEASKKESFDGCLGNWLSILATGGLCALSLDDLKMLATPFMQEEAFAQEGFDVCLTRLASEYRMRIAETMAGRHLENNVHAKNGLICQLSDFGVELEFQDPFVENLPFQSYCNVDAHHVLLLARQENHFHGFIRFWTNLLKTNESLFYLTLNELKEGSVFFLALCEKAESFFKMHPILSASCELEPEALIPLDSWPEDIQNVFSNFSWADFFRQTHQHTPEVRQQLLLDRLLTDYQKYLLLELIYFDELQESQELHSQERLFLFEKDLRHLIEKHLENL